MTVDISLVVSFLAVAVAIFGSMVAYLSTVRMRGTVYRDELSRVELDKTRLALEADIKKMYDEIYRDRGRWEEINHLVMDAIVRQKPRDALEQEKNSVDSVRFLKSFGIDPKYIKVKPDQVFILTPLFEYELPIVNAVAVACRKVGLRAIKGDESKITGSILPVILGEIISSRFVIANLNGRNANVFYEMGIAQALGKDVIMFAHRDNVEDIPFDVAQQQIIFYRTASELHEKIGLAINQLGWSLGRSIPS